MNVIIKEENAESVKYSLSTYNECNNRLRQGEFE